MCIIYTADAYVTKYENLIIHVFHRHTDIVHTSNEFNLVLQPAVYVFSREEVEPDQYNHTVCISVESQ